MKKYGIFLVLTVTFLFPITLYLKCFDGSLSLNHTRWGEFGSFLGGVYGSFALIILIYTTHLTQAQFKRQNEDNVFFKLWDSLQNRIHNSVITVGEENLSAHKCLKYIADRFHEELLSEAVEIGRLLLCKEPETLRNEQYTQLFQAMYGENSFDALKELKDKFIEDIKSCKDFNERWDQLKNYIGSRGSEGEKTRLALRNIGSVYFYKLPFNDRQKHYNLVLGRVMSEYGELLDGYLSNLIFVVALAENSSNSKDYVKYIRSQLTRYEIIIIFYILVGQHIPLPEAAIFKKLGLLNRLKTTDCQSLMIDQPSVEDIDNELEYLFSR